MTNTSKPIGTPGMSCFCCGKELAETDKVIVCADCGAVFCMDCIAEGALESHEYECED